MNENEKFEVEWSEVKAAPRVQPIKPGNYPCSVTLVAYAKAKTGTEGVAVHFVMLEGEYKGMAVPLHHIWARGTAVSDEAKSIAKRDLDLLGFTSFQQIDAPPQVDPTRKFMVTIARDGEHPLGRVFCFNPL